AGDVAEEDAALVAADRPRPILPGGEMRRARRHLLGAGAGRLGPVVERAGELRRGASVGDAPGTDARLGILRREHPGAVDEAAPLAATGAGLVRGLDRAVRERVAEVAEGRQRVGHRRASTG